MAQLRQRPVMTAREPSDQLPDRLVIAKAEALEGLARPFRGIATREGIVPGLFPVEATGVSTELLTRCAEDYLDSLGPDERAAAVFAVDANEWRQWSNIHPFFMRHGLCLEDLTLRQRDAALALVAAALSEEGFATARNIMRLNETLLELSGSTLEYGEWLYWMSIMGNPSSSEPWGFQLDGHHLIVNCLVDGDQLVVAPMFLGAEPTTAPSGRYEGTRVFAAEEAAALRLAQALTPTQFDRCLLGAETPFEIFAAAYRDNIELNYEGIEFAALNKDQQRRLFDLVSCHIGRIRPGHSAVKMSEIERHLDQTYFAWMGSRSDDGVFYYRVHSPVVLIEFDHLAGVAFDNDTPTRRHVHSVVRTPNGNDYGMDLLRQHREAAHGDGR